MLHFIILCFVLAASMGLYLLVYVLKNKNTPKGVAFVHGPLAAIALILLIIYGFFSSAMPIASIIFFILAAFGGLVVIFRDLTGKSIPKWLVLGHGTLAVVGLFCLIFFTFS